MEQIEFVKSGLMISRIGLGTWAMGGSMRAESAVEATRPAFSKFESYQAALSSL